MADRATAACAQHRQSIGAGSPTGDGTATELGTAAAAADRSAAAALLLLPLRVLPLLPSHWPLPLPGARVSPLLLLLLGGPACALGPRRHQGAGQEGGDVRRLIWLR